MELFLKLPVLAACLLLVRAQQPVCDLDSLQDIDQLAPLLQNSLLGGGQGNEMPTVTIRRINVVCLATAPKVGEYGSASLVIQYDCTGANCPTSSQGEATKSIINT